MISFCKPCLKWKFMLAYKDQWGLNGFTFPFLNKYLHSRFKTTLTFYNPSGQVNSVNTAEAECRVDRITGEITPELPAMFFNFYEAYLRGQTTGPNWVVTEDYIRGTFGSPLGTGFVRVYEQWLDEPYTLAQLDADADALIAAVNPDDLPWFKLKTLARFVEVPFDGRVLAEMSAVGPEPQIYIPSPQVYDVYARNDDGLWDVPELKAAAWYIYIPSMWHALTSVGQPPVTPPSTDGPNYIEPSWYIKLVGFFQTQGKFCEKTQYLDYAQHPYGAQTCESKAGSCGSYFKITPPIIAPGRNAVKTLTPNCQCQ